MNHTKNLPASLSRKLLFYSLGTGAASLAATTAQASPADVIATYSAQSGDTLYFNLQNTVPVSTSSSTGEQFLISNYGGAKGRVSRLSSGGTVITQARTGGSSASPVTRNYALELSAGTTIGAGNFISTVGTLDNSNGTTYGPPGRGAGDWKAGNRGFLGLEILVNGQTLYGFADLKVNDYNLSTATQSFILYGFAYDPTGAPITTFQITHSQVPEPGTTTALLVAGAAGVAALRRRHRETPLPAA